LVFSRVRSIVGMRSQSALPLGNRHVPSAASSVADIAARDVLSGEVEKSLQLLGYDKWRDAKQEEAVFTMLSHQFVQVVRPTGTGKTLAFVLPLFARAELGRHGIHLLFSHTHTHTHTYIYI
jgi:superfamily II DNA/RNA helicase